MTAPVGYRTESLTNGQFNLAGVNLSNAVLAAGALEGATATSLQDAEAAFDTALPAGATYIVKITSGAAEGANTTATATDGTNLAIDDNVGAAAGDSYEVRAAVTLTDAFGAAASSALQSGSSETADIVWVPAANGFDQFYTDGTNWKQVGNLFGTFNDAALYVTDGVFVQRRGDDGDVVFVGHVETVKTNFAVEPGFNFISRVLPVDVKIADTLSDDLQAGTSETADIVWLPNGAGGYNQFYVDAAGAIKQVGNLFGTFPDQALSSGVIIQRRGDAANFDIEVPADLDI